MDCLSFQIAENNWFPVFRRQALYLFVEYGSEVLPLHVILGCLSGHIGERFGVNSMESRFGSGLERDAIGRLA